VDNFVDIVRKHTAKPEKSRVLLDCPQKWHFHETYTNQALAVARRLIAGLLVAPELLAPPG
jgi:hypothetical protein